MVRKGSSVRVRCWAWLSRAISGRSVRARWPPSRPRREPRADEDRRLGAYRPDPEGAGRHPRSPQARRDVQQAHRLRVLLVNRQSALTTQRRLRPAQREAKDEHGRLTFDVPHARDETGKPIRVPAGALPSMRSFRHTVASRGLLAGESVDKIAFLLGHCDANVSRAVYVRVVADARRRHARRNQI